MILDTNAYSALARGDQQIATIVRAAKKITLPLPVIAELHAGFLGGSRAEHNRKQLDQFLSQPIISIYMPNIKTVKVYAELQLYCRQQGRALSNNDIWIGALAQQFNDSLVTFDQDFTVLSDLFGDRLTIIS